MQNSFGQVCLKWRAFLTLRQTYLELLEYIKNYNIFHLFHISLISNILYLRVYCNQNQEDLIIILVFIHYFINMDLCIIDK